MRSNTRARRQVDIRVGATATDLADLGADNGTRRRDDERPGTASRAFASGCAECRRQPRGAQPGGWPDDRDRATSAGLGVVRVALDAAYAGGMADLRVVVADDSVLLREGLVRVLGESGCHGRRVLPRRRPTPRTPSRSMRPT